ALPRMPTTIMATTSRTPKPDIMDSLVPMRMSDSLTIVVLLGVASACRQQCVGLHHFHLCRHRRPHYRVVAFEADDLRGKGRESPTGRSDGIGCPAPRCSCALEVK